MCNWYIEVGVKLVASYYGYFLVCRSGLDFRNGRVSLMDMGSWFFVVRSLRCRGCAGF